MATVNLGRIKPVFRGAYNNSTAYVVDDIVTSGNETFICISASTGNATSNGTFWTKLAAKGADGTDVAATLTTQGDILYRDGSGLQRLPKGTAGQVLKMNSGATAPEYGTISTGAYSLAQLTPSVLSLETHAGATHKAYHFGTAITTTPSASTDLIELTLNFSIEGTQDGYYGVAYGVHTSDSWDTNTNSSKLKVSSGEHALGMGLGDDSERYQRISYIGTFTLAQLGMSAGTQYYVKPHVLSHSPSGQVKTAVSTTYSTSIGLGNFTLKRWTA